MKTLLEKINSAKEKSVDELDYLTIELVGLAGAGNLLGGKMPDHWQVIGENNQYREIAVYFDNPMILMKINQMFGVGDLINFEGIEMDEEYLDSGNSRATFFATSVKIR